MFVYTVKDIFQAIILGLVLLAVVATFGGAAIADAFLCDAMGAEYPFRDLDRLPMWFGAARANPEKRAAGMATLRAYQRQIPTEADFARVPAEVPKRDTVLIDPEALIVRDGNGDALGRWHGAKYIGQCPCESGKAFAACHGSADGTAPLPNKWGAEDLGKFTDLDALARFHEPGCEHDKVYSDRVLLSMPSRLRRLTCAAPRACA